MADNTVTISGMFGDGKTYFADAPVIIEVSGLYWGEVITSPFTIVRIEVIYDGNVIGNFHADTGGQSSIEFDIHSALQAIWSDYDFSAEVAKAQAALTGGKRQEQARSMREYSLRVYTEYLSNDDGGVFVKTGFGPFTGGRCLIGTMTEWERYTIGDQANADVSHLEHTGVRNGDASTKPSRSPERVGRDSITSWVDVQQGYTKSIFYPASTFPESDDVIGRQQGWTGHAPLVLRDSVPYADFLFKNRRGAIETCSALIKESMDINVETQQYAHIERPTFKPSRSLTAIGTDGRRSWQMSSGYQTSEWAEWWTTEFLGGKRKRWWMLYKGIFVPVTVEPAKKETTIYDKSKQQMPSVEFTVTLALEG